MEYEWHSYVFPSFLSSFTSLGTHCYPVAPQLQTNMERNREPNRSQGGDRELVYPRRNMQVCVFIFVVDVYVCAQKCKSDHLGEHLRVLIEVRAGTVVGRT